MGLKGSGGVPVLRVEFEVRVKELKNGKDEIIREIIKGVGDKVLDWIWMLCNMAFER